MGPCGLWKGRFDAPIRSYDIRFVLHELGQRLRQRVGAALYVKESGLLHEAQHAHANGLIERRKLPPEIDCNNGMGDLARRAVKGHVDNYTLNIGRLIGAEPDGTSDPGSALLQFRLTSHPFSIDGRQAAGRRRTYQA